MYTLIEFITRDRSPLMEKIDIVPSFWIDYNSQTKKLFTRFLSPPYTSENVNNLHNMIKNCDYPLQEWPLYSVILKGRASKCIYFCNYLYTFCKKYIHHLLQKHMKKHWINLYV